MTFKRLMAVLALAAALVAAGCGDDDKEQEAAAPAAPAISMNLDEEPLIPKPEGEPPTELVTEDIVEGDGKEAKPGDEVSVQYTGVTFSTGDKFDASWDRGREPFTFQVGASQVIQGWDEGIPGMKEGGRRQLTIPSELAYGAEGRPPAIGPDETLIFVVDLEKVG